MKRKVWTILSSTFVIASLIMGCGEIGKNKAASPDTGRPDRPWDPLDPLDPEFGRCLGDQIYHPSFGCIRIGHCRPGEGLHPTSGQCISVHSNHTHGFKIYEGDLRITHNSRWKNFLEMTGICGRNRFLDWRFGTEDCGTYKRGFIQFSILGEKLPTRARAEIYTRSSWTVNWPESWVRVSVVEGDLLPFNKDTGFEMVARSQAFQSNNLLTISGEDQDLKNRRLDIKIEYRREDMATSNVRWIY